MAYRQVPDYYNARSIQGVVVDDANKADGRALVYDSATDKIVYEDVVSGGGSGHHAGYFNVGSSQTVTVDTEKQMTVFFQLVTDGELIIDGQLILEP